MHTKVKVTRSTFNCTGVAIIFFTTKLSFLPPMNPLFYPLFSKKPGTSSNTAIDLPSN